MAVIPPPPVPTQLIVFADDWGRHPSSTQHLIRELLPQYPTLWVNTVGTRRPRFCWADIKRGFMKVASILSASDGVLDHMDPDLPENLYVIEPLMYPGFRTSWQRRFNRAKLTRSIHQCFGETFATKPLFERNPSPPSRRVVITTLPITADLVGSLSADRWVYTCVDDYSQWPGTDHAVMDAMERQLVGQVDATTAASEVLRDRLVKMGAQPGLLEHGVDPELWQTPSAGTRLAGAWPADERPIALFWGLLDARLDTRCAAAIAGASDTHVVMAGPHAPAFEAGALEGRCILTGMIALGDLPAHAAAASVLIMPYIDAPVTRAMQPLKLKEYLATMKPVVVRDLPSTRGWSDCCDLADNADEFVRLVKLRAQTGTPAAQLEARRRRLAGESWAAKAAQLAELINAGATPHGTGSG